MIPGLRSIRSRMTQVLNITGYVLKWGLISHVVVEYAGCIVICQGGSMEPTLRTGDIILTDHITPRFGRGIKRGDIVVLRSPTNPAEHVCKRVVGIAGDHIPKNPTLARHGYGAETFWDKFISRPSVVPRGYIWIEGDNVSNSTDSRNYGAIPAGLIRGRVLFRLFPPSKLPNYSPRGFLMSGSGSNVVR